MSIENTEVFKAVAAILNKNYKCPYQIISTIAREIAIDEYIDLSDPEGIAEVIANIEGWGKR